ncbi:MAG: urease accessory protein UreF [Lachnospiraceae bacterium]|nr:urease accessory protein UreF [Robinsoniella sp.]MDY3767325.1 urease accessory protein UreF [Lachnospiraceae bacterium]
MDHRFYLLQVNDALFPIGAYSHSQGLETYIQKGIVKDETSAEAFLTQKIRRNFLYTELLAARLCYEKAMQGNLEKIEQVEEILTVSRVPMEQREAAKKMGSRFAKTIRVLNVPFTSDIFERYLNAREGKTLNHCCIYGVFCAALGIEEDESLLHYLYAQTSAMVTNCVKTIPLSQSSGQKLLKDCYPVLEEVLKKVKDLTEEELCLSAPGFDLRSMQHERLYSRIYMS